MFTNPTPNLTLDFRIPTHTHIRFRLYNDEMIRNDRFSAFFFLFLLRYAFSHITYICVCVIWRRENFA